jgi:UDP-glucose 4-epimerase
VAVFFITGGSGFIGLNTIRYLAEKRHKVVGIDNYITSSKEIYAPVLAYLEQHWDVDFYKADAQYYGPDLQGIFDKYKFDYIIHLAAIPSVPRSVENPFQIVENNVIATLNILEIARKYNIKKLVYAGSSSYYGGESSSSSSNQIDASIKAPLCKSPYAASKAAGELLVNSYFHTYGLPTIILRYFNVFGPYQNPNSPYSAVIPNFITKILKNEQPIIYGDGFQIRDFTYVENICQANYLAACSDESGKIYDIGCGTNINLINLVGLINLLTGKKIQPIYKFARQGDVRFSTANITQAFKDLNYVPEITLREGLKKTISYFKESLLYE